METLMYSDLSPGRPPDDMCPDWYRAGWRFGRYGVEREGLLRYRVCWEGDDGIVRPCGAARFFRWITAARVAQELFLAHARGYRDDQDACLSIVGDELFIPLRGDALGDGP